MQKPLDTPAERVHPSRGMGHRQMSPENAPGGGAFPNRPLYSASRFQRGMLTPDRAAEQVLRPGLLTPSRAGHRPRCAGATVQGLTTVAPYRTAVPSIPAETPAGMGVDRSAKALDGGLGGGIRSAHCGAGGEPEKTPRCQGVCT